jgi:hypothetical protein
LLAAYARNDRRRRSLSCRGTSFAAECLAEYPEAAEGVADHEQDERELRDKPDAVMVVEAVVDIVASSLALFSVAGHMLTDAAAIGLSLIAISLAARPAKGAMTYG